MALVVGFESCVQLQMQEVSSQDQPCAGVRVLAPKTGHSTGSHRQWDIWDQKPSGHQAPEATHPGGRETKEDIKGIASVI